MDLDVTKPKFFQFNVTIEGIDYTALSGKLEFIYENIIYAFPTKIYKDRVEVEIPPLQSVIKKHILESDNITANLEIIGDSFHLPAWKSEMNIQRSLFIESDKPVIDDVDDVDEIVKSNPKPSSIYDNIIKEDIEFLKKLRIDNESDTFSFINESNPRKKVKKNKFDKRKFLKEATEQEKYAVENNISLKETSKNDSVEQRNFRMKIRNIVQEGYIKKLKISKQQKPIQTTSVVKEGVIEQPVQEIVSEAFDVKSFNESNINRGTIRLMMESVGMKTDKTQNRMIEHAKDTGAKTDIQIFDSIKSMIYPPQVQNNDLQESYAQAMKVFSKNE